MGTKRLILFSLCAAVTLMGCRKFVDSKYAGEPATYNISTQKQIKVGDTITAECLIVYENAQTINKSDFKKLKIASSGIYLLEHKFLGISATTSDTVKVITSYYKETGQDGYHQPVFTYDGHKQGYYNKIQMVMLKPGTFTFTGIANFTKPFVLLIAEGLGQKVAPQIPVRVILNGKDVSNTLDQFTVVNR